MIFVLLGPPRAGFVNAVSGRIRSGAVLFSEVWRRVDDNELAVKVQLTHATGGWDA